ncbi:hypothetical protein FEM21_01560 [Flavobacterium seoulense]|uniref:Uncharacterized protein n=1 Tax=Flavobacterium seoulense TaxID=1492738 RepID=A0A066WVN0_9FLAO|nr:hypothetical protein FEM21_01560 [Flavobacterium seoulense]
MTSVHFENFNYLVYKSKKDPAANLELIMYIELRKLIF